MPLDIDWRTVAERVIPDGSCTLSKRPKAFPSSGCPEYAAVGQGPYVIATDGRAYLDMVCALGALTIGHAHPKVVEAVEVQLRAGSIFSLPSIMEGHVAERLCEVIPCAEQVKFVKTGSEACSAAVRIARMATGRDLVLTTDTSYHGWHDQFIAAKPRHPGVPSEYTVNIGTFKFNDLDSLNQWNMKGAQVAAVIFEPVQGEEPQHGFLEAVVTWAHKRGAVVIFDEMLAGGRLALGGAQEYYGVVPDLACFGKALGGGLPLAFVCGSSALMQHAWPVSGTFSGDTLALAACNAMLDLYASEGIVSRLWTMGGILQSAFGVTPLEPKRQLVDLTVHGHPPRFWLTLPEGVDRRVAMSVFVQKCAARGVLVHQAVVFASAALSAGQAQAAADIMADAMEDVSQGVLYGDLQRRLVGQPYEDSVR